MQQKQCKHKNTNRIFFANGDVEIVCSDCCNILNVKIEEDQAKKPPNNQLPVNNYLGFIIAAAYKSLNIKKFNY